MEKTNNFVIENLSLFTIHFFVFIAYVLILIELYQKTKEKSSENETTYLAIGSIITMVYSIFIFYTIE